MYDFSSIDRGNGISVSSSYVTISNCTVFGNANKGISLSGSEITLRNTIIHADGVGRYAINSWNALLSDYNDLFVTNGAILGSLNGVVQPSLADWRRSGMDSNSLSTDPQFVNPTMRDLHLKSTAGSYHGGAWTADGSSSPCIDMGIGEAGLEPAPNTSPGHDVNIGRLNLGAYGGTEQASKTPLERKLNLMEPIGRENVVDQAMPLSIRWTWMGEGWQSNDKVRLEYSADAGQTWNGMAGGSGVAATNEVFRWDISGMSPGALYLARITCNQDETAVSHSPAVFRIGSSLVFYVNDASLSLDEWCVAVGNDANTGTDPAHPKATPQGILNAYTLVPGDTVRIDTGIYTLTTNITVGVMHSGMIDAPVVFEASPYGVTLNRNSTANGCYGWNIVASNVTVRTAQSSKFPEASQSWMKIRGGYSGLTITGNYCHVSRVDVCSNYSYGVSIGGVGVVIENSLSRNATVASGGAGIRINASFVTISNCTVFGNAYGIYIAGYSDTLLRNNIIRADGSGAFAVYRTLPGYSLFSDYNDLSVTNGAAVGYYSYAVKQTLADWILTGQDTNSLSLNPQFANVAAGDFHLKSVEGRYVSANLWTNDTAHSACIDAGDPGSDWTNETAPHGSRINMGAYGNTEQASRSLTNSVVSLDVQSPFGASLPAIGSSLYYPGKTLSCQLSGSPAQIGITQYVCTGWVMQGSEPATGSGTNVTILLTNSTVLTWQWVTNVPPVAKLVSAGQTSSNGEGRVTINCSVSDVKGQSCQAEVLYSTNGAVSWTNLWVADVSSSVGSVTLTNGAPCQIGGVETTNGIGLTTNLLAIAWDTTGNGLSIALSTNTRIRLRVWNGILWSSAVTSTPFCVDNQAPGAGILAGSTPMVGVWSTNRNIVAQWVASDGAGTGIKGYGYAFTNEGAAPAPLAVMTTGSNGMSEALADGTNWWLALRAVDKAGNWGMSTSFGPFWIDGTAPTYSDWIRTPSNLTAETIGTIQVTAQIDDPLSGLETNKPEIEYRLSGSAYSETYIAMTMTNGAWAVDLDLDWKSMGGKTLFYRVRSRDAAGNVSVSSEQEEMIDAGVIGVTPDQLTYTGIYGGPDPLPQVFVITNTGTAGFVFSNVVANGEASWFSPGPSRGRVESGASVAVSGGVSILGLPAGVYSVTNHVFAPTATNAAQDIVLHLIIQKASQTITQFLPVNGSVFAESNTVSLSATASSGLAVSFASNTLWATVSGTDLFFTSHGSTEIVASQGGDENYDAAIAVTNVYTVLRDGDSDGDGMSDWNEYLAGTSPSNPASVFTIKGAVQIIGTGFVIQWNSSSNQIYTLERATNLSWDGFLPLVNCITATPPDNVHTDNVQNATPGYFYRLKTKR